MAIPAWPTSLPQFSLRQGYSEGFKQTVIRSTMDSGATKRRARFTNSPTILNVTMPMNDAELATFKTFFEDTLVNGALSFTFPHPRLGTTVTVVFRNDPTPFVPEGGNTYILNLNLEILQ